MAWKEKLINNNNSLKAGERGARFIEESHFI